MKKILALAFSLGVFAMQSNAQVSKNSDHHQRVHRDSTHNRSQMMKDLNLTESQKAQLQASRQQMRTQMEAIKNDSSLSPQQKKEKMQQLHQSQRTAMNSVLTAEQKSKLKAEITEKKDWKGKHKGDRKQGILKDLNLTEVQKTELKADREIMKQKREAIKNDVTLNDTQKKEKMRELYRSHKEKMNSILTPEQKAKLEAAKKDSREKKKIEKIDTKKNIM